MMQAAKDANAILDGLGLSTGMGEGRASPVDGSIMPGIAECDAAGLEAAITSAAQAFQTWRATPAPVRGELVRRFGETLRANKDLLGRLVTLETGKPLSEGLGEVQEMIDICDFAVGLSRQLYGLTIASERPDHHMREMWHPLGPVGIISAFNFPVAVWAWNAALALVCGNPVLWKPSEKTPLTAFAAEALLRKTIKDFEPAPARPVRPSHRRRSAGRSLGQGHAGATDFRHRQHSYGPRGGHGGGGPVRTLAAGIGRQRRHHRDAVGGSGSGASRHRLRRGGHIRSALHHLAAFDRAAGRL